MTDPRRLWTPSLGYVFGLTPADMGDLTGQQYREANDFIREMNKGRK